VVITYYQYVKPNVAKLKLAAYEKSDVLTKDIGQNACTATNGKQFQYHRGKQI